jgi:cytochrome c-type biogenesis protein CcmE
MVQPETPSLAPRRRTKFVAGAAVIMVVLVGLVVWAMARPGAASMYLTPSEVEDMVLLGGEVRMSGTVVDGSIATEGLTTSFLVTDGSAEVGVTTDSPMPDAFLDSSEVVAIGSVEDGSFVATRVLAKCPSKFKAKV